MPRLLAPALLIVFATACGHGEWVYEEAWDGGGGPFEDAGAVSDAGLDFDGGAPALDAGLPLADAGAPGADAGLPGEDGGATVDAGLPFADAGVDPADAGEGPRCGDGLCEDGENCAQCAADCGPCTCGTGFLLDAALGCVPDAPEPFRSRSEGQVCTRWSSDWLSVSPEWEALDGTDPCDPGVVSQAAQDNGLRRTNLYRWLAGLPPVTLASDRLGQQQACAVILEAMGRLDHHPPSDAPCYTAAGAAGAGSSNLAMGGGLASSVDLYVNDGGVASLGHRRWVLSRGMGVTAFGLKGRWSCMYAFGGGGVDPGLPFVAWPPPGYVPARAAGGKFWFGSQAHKTTASTVIEVAVGEGPYTQVSHTSLSYGYGTESLNLTFDPPGGSASVWRAGTTVRIAILNLDGGDVRYTARFVACP